MDIYYRARLVPLIKVAASKLCPKDPRHYFIVSTDKDIFFCRDCQWGGDVLVYLEQTQLWTKKQAAMYLIEHFKIDKEIF